MIVNKPFCNVAGHEWLRACYLSTGSGADRSAAMAPVTDCLDYVARCQLTDKRAEQARIRALHRIGF